MLKTIIGLGYKACVEVEGMKSSHYGPYMLGYTRAATLKTIRYYGES